MEVSVKSMVNETKTYGNNGFRKREVVITTEEQYPQHILVEFIQDKCDLLNNSIGTSGKITSTPRSRMGQSSGKPNILIPSKGGA